MADAASAAARADRAACRRRDDAIANASRRVFLAPAEPRPGEKLGKTARGRRRTRIRIRIRIRILGVRLLVHLLVHLLVDVRVRVRIDRVVVHVCEDSRIVGGRVADVLSAVLDPLSSDTSAALLVRLALGRLVFVTHRGDLFSLHRGGDVRGGFLDAALRLRFSRRVRDGRLSLTLNILDSIDILGLRLRLRGEAFLRASRALLLALGVVSALGGSRYLGFRRRRLARQTILLGDETFPILGRARDDLAFLGEAPARGVHLRAKGLAA